MMINRKSIPRRDSTIEEQGNEEEEDDEDYESVDLGILTDDVIKSTLSNLVRSPIDLKYVYCKCVLSNKVCEFS